MDGSQIVAIFAGLASVVTAVGGVILALRKSGDDPRLLRRELVAVRKRFDRAEGYIFVCVTMIRRLGAEPPDRPADSYPEEDEARV